MKILCLLAVLYTSIVLSTSTPPINSDVIQAVMAELQKIQANEPEAPIPDESTRQVTLQQSSTVGGTVYTRWGNSECPGYAELVYVTLPASTGEGERDLTSFVNFFFFLFFFRFIV